MKIIFKKVVFFSSLVILSLMFVLTANAFDKTYS